MATQRWTTKGRKRKLYQGESQLPDGRFMYRYTDSYGVRRKVYSWKLEPSDYLPVGKKDKKSLRELEDEINATQVKGIDSFSSRKTTLNERWEFYLAKKTLKASTKSNYEYLWDTHIRNSLGRLKLCELNKTQVTNHYLQLYDVKGLSESSVLSIHHLVSPVLDDCVDDDLIVRNYSTGAIKTIREKEHKKQEEYQKQVASGQIKEIKLTECLSAEQEIAFLEFLYNDERCAKWKNLFIVALRTGARISELCGLTRKDIDFKKGIIHIRRNVLYRKIDGICQLFVTSTKTLAGTRKFPIYCEELKKALKDEISKYDNDGMEIDGVSGWVFRNRYGDKPMTENNCNDGLRRILSYYNKSVKNKELKIRGFTCHKFRHTFATKCEVKDVSDRAKKSLLGHSPEKDDVTERYVHPPFEYVQQQAQKLNEP